MYIRRGFTLIELLVVITILVILAALLFPVFAQVREKSLQAVCLSNGKQMALAFAMYAQDYDERLPRWWTPNGGVHNDQRDWKDDTAPYVKNTQVFFCPSKPKLWAGYGFNAYLLIDAGKSLDEIEYPSRQLLSADVREMMPGWNYATDRVFPIGCVWEWNGDDRFQAEARHHQGLIVTFADAHAKWRSNSRATNVLPPGSPPGTTVPCYTANDPAVGTYWLPTAESP